MTSSRIGFTQSAVFSIRDKGSSIKLWAAAVAAVDVLNEASSNPSSSTEDLLP